MAKWLRRRVANAKIAGSTPVYRTQQEGKVVEPGVCEASISGFKSRPADQFGHLLALESPMNYIYKINKNRRQVEGNIEVPTAGTAVKVIVGLDGYDYKYYRERKRNVHLAMNGAAVLSFDELDEFADALKAMVAEAREELRKL